MKCNVCEIWYLHYKNLRMYIFSKVKDWDATDDILSHTLINFVNYCESRNDIKNIRGWLFKIAYNNTMDHFKRDARRVLLDFDVVDDSEENTHAVSEWLYHFISELPLGYQEPLVLYDIVGTPQKTIATKMGLSLEATKSRIQRARKMLKEKFEQCGKLEISSSQLYEFTPTQSCCLSL